MDKHNHLLHTDSSQLKEISFHLIIYILSSFTHPQVVSNLTWMNFILLLNTKDDILKNVGNQTVYGPH